mgnify:CR=1 FL=1|jgi:hypothetical protein
MNQFDFFGIDDTIIDVDMPKPSRFRSALGSCAFAAGATTEVIKSFGRGAYNITADVARYASNNPGEMAMLVFAVAAMDQLEDIEEAL